MNWDDDYEKMIAVLPEYFRTFEGEATEQACSIAEKVSYSSDEELLHLLIEAAVKWVLENNQPVGLESVDYDR